MWQEAVMELLRLWEEAEMELRKWEEAVMEYLRFYLKFGWGS
jgi:hypothetical protein